MRRRGFFGVAMVAVAAFLIPGYSAIWASQPVISLNPSYTSRLSHHIGWRSFPLRVYFVPDEQYSPLREQAAVAGFDEWVQDTDGFVRYVLVGHRSDADITVHFNPASDDGYTTTEFTGARITSADVSIGIRRGGAIDVQATAAHEFGHALGIDGHSDDPRDLMYPIHWLGRPGYITDRDLNTLASAYPSFARVRAARAVPAGGRV